MLAFSTQRYQYLLDDVCRSGHGNDAGRFERGTVQVRPCPDGERILRLTSSTVARDVAIVGGTISDADTLELFDLACGAVQQGARSLTLVVPYFGYSTMERPGAAGEVVTAKNRARLLSTIPLAPGGNRVILLDLHTEGLPYYFEGPVRPVHVSARPLAIDAIQRLGEGDFVLGCADAGGVKRVQSLAQEMKVPAAYVFKRRLAEDRTEVTAVSAEVEGRRVVIFDDMIRSGTTLLSAARAYREAGARSVAAVAVHGVLPGDALQRLKESGLMEAVACTDSHPRARDLECDFLSVLPVGELLAGFAAL